jgi:RNA polymerase sigma-70 factor (ECF subfamily)
VDLSDEELARRAGRNDLRAFEEIYRRYADRLWRVVIWPMLRDDARSEDALAETFFSAMEALPRFVPRPRAEATGDALWPWLSQIARRKALDEIRGQGRAQRLEARLDAEATALPAAPTPHNGVAEREQAARRAERVDEILREIHPRYAEVIRLRLWEGLEREECARRLEVKLGTLDVLLHRALRSFREAYLGRHGKPPEEDE